MQMTAIISRRNLLAAGAVTALAGTTLGNAAWAQTPRASAGSADPGKLLRGGWQPGQHDVATARRWARDTWKSLVAMTDEHTGLPADNIGASVTSPVRSNYTSPTNIGGYLWSTVVARELGIISPAESLRRITQTLTTMSHRTRLPTRATTPAPDRTCTTASSITTPATPSPASRRTSGS